MNLLKDLRFRFAAVGIIVIFAIIKAINIPAETFAFRSDILPKEKKIIVTCNTGSRSYLAYRKLIQLAYPNIYQTLIADWKDAGMKLEK